MQIAEFVLCKNRTSQLNACGKAGVVRESLEVLVELVHIPTHVSLSTFARRALVQVGKNKVKITVVQPVNEILVSPFLILHVFASHALADDKHGAMQSIKH